MESMRVPSRSKRRAAGEAEGSGRGMTKYAGQRGWGAAGLRNCRTALRSPSNGLLHFLQRVLQEEPHELRAGGERARRRVAVVAILGTARPGVAPALDGEEGDLGST